MSSTNRSRARDNHIADYYVTPVPAICAFIQAFVKVEPHALRGVVLDPCAGGRIGKEQPSYPIALAQEKIPYSSLVTMDIREDSRAQYRKDFLAVPAKEVADVVITNPPFNIAMEIIEKALAVTKPGGG